MENEELRTRNGKRGTGVWDRDYSLICWWPWVQKDLNTRFEQTFEPELCSNQHEWKMKLFSNGFYLNFYLQVHSSYSMIVGYYLRVKNSRMRIVTDISKNGFVYLRKTDTSTTVKLSSLEDLQWVASQSRAKYYCLDDMIIRNKLQWSCEETKRKRGPVNYYCASYFTLNLEVTWLSIMGSLIILSLLIGGRNLDKLNSLYD